MGLFHFKYDLCAQPPRFFYPGPILLRPSPDQFFVALEGAWVGLLHTPAQIMQQAADLIAMITYAKLAFDHLLHSGLGHLSSLQ